MTTERLGALAFVVFFALGVRASVRLSRRYKDSREGIEPRNRPILATIVLASWIVTLTSGWIGTLSLIRLFTGRTFEWTPPVTLLLAVLVISIPVLFDLVLNRVAGLSDRQ